MRRLSTLLCFVALVIAGAAWYRQKRDEASREAPPPLSTREDGRLLPPVENRCEGLLADSRNGDPFVESPGYRALIEQLSRGNVPEDLVDLDPVYLDYHDAVGHPDSWRGQRVRVRGVVHELWPVKLTAPISQQGDVYRGVIVQPDGSDGVICDMLAKPDPPPDDRNAYEVVGVYYRVLRYETRNDPDGDGIGEFKEVPYVLAQSVTRVATGKKTWMMRLRDPLQLTVIGVALVLMLIVWRMHRAKQRRTHQAFTVIR